MSELSAKQVVYLPFDKLDHYSGLCKVIRDHWWAVDPEKGLIFYAFSRRRPSLQSASPQCNSNKEIADRVLVALWPGAECRFVERVIVPIDVHDYA